MHKLANEDPSFNVRYRR
ncbi:MAG: hypothetical protein MZV63_09650 [Marinilabiliales bacterium]|nr:hypothetical protein [Marinilabiliales bacterium]